MIKKIFLLPVLFISIFFNIFKVNADTTDESYYFSNFYNNYEAIYDIYHNTTIINTLIEYYNTNLSSTYSDYIITYNSLPNSQFAVTILGTNNLDYYLVKSNVNTVPSFSHPYDSSISGGNGYQYNSSLNNGEGGYGSAGGQLGSFSTLLVTSSSPLILNTSGSYCNQSGITCLSVAQTPSYSNLTYDVAYPQLDIEEGEEIPTFLSLTNGSPSADFTTVNLNDYAYIILSLKNYNTSSFNTTIYTQGKLCFTPVYDYGMKEKYTYYSGYKTMGCSETYSTLTPVAIYIIPDDLTYHAVYYIKPYETLTTTLKIPTSIFDITYVSQQNADNPNVIVDGRSYPAIPYSQLVDTANKSSEEGYISGQVCVLGDINCTASQNDFSIEDIFTAPLTTLRTVWSSIVSVFALITTFIVLLPPILQAFLYSSFFLAIILGLLKMIL